MILAAGGSKRMGTPKQLLPWAGNTLLGHAVTKAKELTNDTILVILGAHSEEIKPTLAYAAVAVTVHKDWKKGLGTSIAWGVGQLVQRESQWDGILIMLADQPLITSDYLSSILNRYKAVEQPIIATTYSDQKLGVPALFDRCYFEELMQLTGDKGAKEIMQKHKDKLVLLHAEEMLADIDTLDDYRRLYMANHQS